jgi:hypothetical protein
MMQYPNFRPKTPSLLSKVHSAIVTVPIRFYYHSGSMTASQLELARRTVVKVGAVLSIFCRQYQRMSFARLNCQMMCRLVIMAILLVRFLQHLH